MELNRLRIKYGLSPQEPTETQARQWAARARQLIGQGTEAELAGVTAGRELFSTFGRYRYAGEADTIYDLLIAIENK